MRFGKLYQILSLISCLALLSCGESEPEAKHFVKQELDIIEIQVDSFRNKINQIYEGHKNVEVISRGGYLILNIKESFASKLWSHENYRQANTEYGDINKYGFRLLITPGAQEGRLFFKSKISKGYINVPVGMLYQMLKN